MTETVRPIDAHGRRVQAMFGDIAPGYDRANRWMSLGIDVRWRRRAVRDLIPRRFGERGRVLDLCAGTLDSAIEIHRRWPRARITAGDFSDAMLAEGQQRLRRLGPSFTRAITTRTMDAHELPLPDDAVDAAFCAFGMRNLSDPGRAVDELARVLVPGGQLVVLEFFRPHRAAARTVHALYNHTVLPAVGWACTGNLEAYRYLPRSIGAFDTVDEFAALLRRHGFEGVAVEPLTLGVASIVRATREAPR